MSIALKRQQFRTQIRRQSVRKILQQKKLIISIEQQVNQTFQNWCDTNLSTGLPKVCALKFQFLNNENKFKMIELVKQREIKLDFFKPQHIALVNKISLTQEHILSLFLEEITTFADKMILSLSGNQKLLVKDHFEKLFPYPNQQLVENLMLFPNCLLEFWANFFSIKEQEIEIHSYCVVLKAFNYWFGSKSNFFKHFNKYSLCLFIKNFLEFQNIFLTQSNYHSFKIVEELHIKFKIVSMPLIGILLEEGFVSDEFLQILSYIAQSSFRRHLLKSLLCRRDRKRTIFVHLMQILEDQSQYQKQLKSSTFFFSEQIDNEKLRKLSQYSIESMIVKNSGAQIWQRKIRVLKIMNSLLNEQIYHQQLLKGDIKWIFERLFSIYIYSVQRDRITSQIQRSISILVYNILLLVQNAVLQVEGFQYSEQQIDQNEDQQLTLDLSTQDIIQKQKNKHTQVVLKQYFMNEFNIYKVIQKSSFSNSQQTIQILSLINQISLFTYTKDFDESILESNMLEKILDILTNYAFNQSELESILEKLFEILMNLHQKNFNFTKYSNQLVKFKHAQITSLLSQAQQTLLEDILPSFQ